MATPAIHALSPKRRVARFFYTRTAKPSSERECNWYALRTRSNFEFLVETVLASQSVETVLPFYLQRAILHGANVTRRRPLFPGYVFAQADAGLGRSSLLAVRGVVALVGGRRPEPIPAGVIENLRIVARDPAALRPAAPREGEAVTVACGPFAGVTGVMQRTAGRNRLIVCVDLFGRACALEIGEAEVYRAGRTAA